MCFSHDLQGGLRLDEGRSARSARAFNFPFSLSCGEVVADRAAGGVRPARAPVSRALRHSLRCEEYNPSRRSRTPRSAGVAASYSMRTSSLYFAVNDRRRGWSERGLIAPFSREPVCRSAAVRVMGIKPVLALCGREKELPEVSHVSLTHRGSTAAGSSSRQNACRCRRSAWSSSSPASGLYPLLRLPARPTPAIWPDVLTLAVRRRYRGR